MTLSIFSRVKLLTGRSQNFYSHAGLKRVRQRSDECVVYRRTPMWSTFIRGAHLPAPVHQPAPVCSRSFVIWLMCVCSRLPLKIADLSCHGTPPTSALAMARHRRVHILQVKDALCKSRASPPPHLRSPRTSSLRASCKVPTSSSHDDRSCSSLSAHSASSPPLSPPCLSSSLLTELLLLLAHPPPSTLHYHVDCLVD